MGSYTFKWDLPADEVCVTGTFDNWTKSIKLNNEEGIFQKHVNFQDGSKKIYFKFVVDNNWVLDESAPKEPDHEGNLNNFLTPQQIAHPTSEPAVINSVTPASTTAVMAAEQPIEKKVEETVNTTEEAPAALAQETPSDISGGFPATPAADLDKPIGINPLPAADGALNPIKLAPGETVPETITAASTTSHVKLDKDSYEKSDTLPGVTPIVSELPPVLSTTIPESSLPMIDPNDITISSVGPDSTTVALAAEVPVETKVPEVVKESQEKANVEPEASAVPAEVNDKAKVEEELKETVPEAAATSEGTAGVGTEKKEDSTNIAALAATAGGAVIASAIATTNAIQEKAAPVIEDASKTANEVANNAAKVATDAANDAAQAAAEAANNNLPDSVKEQLPVAVQETLAAQKQEEVRQEVSPEVPAEVKESLQEARQDPEAAASTVAVEEKKFVEAELLSEVVPAPAVDEAAPAAVTEAKAEPETTAVTAADIQQDATAVVAAGVKHEADAEAEQFKEEIKAAASSEESKTEEPKSEPATTAPADPTLEPAAAATINSNPETKAEAAPETTAPETAVPETAVPKTAVPETVVPETTTETATETTAPVETPEIKTTPATGTENGNGTSEPKVHESKPEETTANGTPSEHKKKNRLSLMFSKLKHRISDKK